MSHLRFCNFFPDNGTDHEKLCKPLIVEGCCLLLLCDGLALADVIPLQLLTTKKANTLINFIADIERRDILASWLVVVVNSQSLWKDYCDVFADITRAMNNALVDLFAKSLIACWFIHSRIACLRGHYRRTSVKELVTRTLRDDMDKSQGSKDLESRKRLG